MRPIYSPNYTQLPNAVLDNLPEFSDAELRVVLCICRQTFGWHRDTFKASVSFIAKGVGMSEQGVRNAVESLMARGVINREKHGQTFAYEIATLPETPSTPLTPSLPQPLNAVDPHPSTPLTPFSLNPSTPLREINKGTETKGNKSAGVPPAPASKSPKRELTDGWCAKWQAHHGMPYKFEGAKDGRAADRLLSLALSPADILAIAEQAWRHPEWFNCKQAATLAGFECRFNDIRLELKNPPGNRRTQTVAPLLTSPRVVNGNY